VAAEVTDFCGQMKFLGISPFDTPAYFTNYVRPSLPTPLLLSVAAH
jgi:hypothetical protein